MVINNHHYVYCRHNVKCNNVIIIIRGFVLPRAPLICWAGRVWNRYRCHAPPHRSSGCDARGSRCYRMIPWASSLIATAAPLSVCPSSAIAGNGFHHVTGTVSSNIDGSIVHWKMVLLLCCRVYHKRTHQLTIHGGDKKWTEWQHDEKRNAVWRKCAYIM